MSLPNARVPTAVALVTGLLLGWLMATLPRPAARLHAESADRWGDMALTSGPVMMRYDDRLKTALKQEAVYYLDYRGGRLLGTIPSYMQKGNEARVLDTFAERDLVSDFKLDPEAGPRPHFLMTTCELGAYSLGWAPLLVFETTSNQVATYRLQQQTVGIVSRPVFTLLEVRPIASAAPMPAP